MLTTQNKKSDIVLFDRIVGLFLWMRKLIINIHAQLQEQEFLCPLGGVRVHHIYTNLPQIISVVTGIEAFLLKTLLQT